MTERQVPDEGEKAEERGSSDSGVRRRSAAVFWRRAWWVPLAVIVPIAGFTVGQALLLPRRFGVHPVLTLVDITAEPPSGALISALPVEMATFGDSAMSGVGVHVNEDALPVQLALRVAELVGRPVHVEGYARAGARTIDVLTEQLPRVLRKPDVSILVVGTNDVTGVTPPAKLARATNAVLDALEALGASVVMSTLPRFRTMRLPHPLMEVATMYAAVVGAVQRRAAAKRPGVHLVDVGLALGPEYFADIATVSADAIHPSAHGYGRIADVLVPAVLSALETS